MFPLFGSTFPRSSEELATAIDQALRPVFGFPPSVKIVTITGDAFPVIERLSVNLSNGAINPNKLPPRPQPSADRAAGVEVGTLEVIGRPILYSSSKLDFELRATDVKCDFAKDVDGVRSLLVLKSAKEGTIDASIAMRDLQAALLQVASQAAAQHGVAVQELEIRLSSAGPRSVAADVRVKAKKSIMSGVVHVRGRLDIDAQLNASLTGLSCSGEGMVGSIAAGMLQSKLKQVEGKKLPLLAMSMGDVSLRDVSISTNDPLRVTATFG